MSGALYLSMRPTYSSTKRAIGFDNVGFATTTVSAVNKAGASWLLTKLLLDTVQSNLNYVVGKKLDSIAVALNSYLNRSLENVGEIQGQLDPPVVEGVFMSKRELRVRVLLSGHAGFKLRQ